MNNLLFGAIAPHGLSEIETLAGDEFNNFKKIAKAMEKLSKDIMELDIDTIIIMTPHGLRVEGYTSIYSCNYISGEYNSNSNNYFLNKKNDVFNKINYEYLNFECDTTFANNIYKEALNNDIKVVSINYGVSKGPLSDIKMDWGVFVPMWFLRNLQNKIKLVVINPDRNATYLELEKLGEIIYSEIEKSDKKFGIVASADQGHAHQVDGPYGYDINSKIYDDYIIKIIKNNQLEQLKDVYQNYFKNSKADSIWQMIILYGAIKNTDFKHKFYEYDIPTYFGMLVAGYFRK